MPSCYLCGKYIPVDQGLRRQVITSVCRQSFGKRVARSLLRGNISPLLGGTTKTHGIRTICRLCAREQNNGSADFAGDAFVPPGLDTASLGLFLAATVAIVMFLVFLSKW